MAQGPSVVSPHGITGKGFWFGCYLTVICTKFNSLFFLKHFNIFPFADYSEHVFLQVEYLLVTAFGCQHASNLVPFGSGIKITKSVHLLCHLCFAWFLILLIYKDQDYTTFLSSQLSAANALQLEYLLVMPSLVEYDQIGI